MALNWCFQNFIIWFYFVPFRSRYLHADCKSIMLFKRIFLLLLLFKQVKTTSFNITNECHSVDYNQTVSYDNSGCGPVKQIQIPNKRCVGVCYNMYIPEQDPMHPFPGDHCIMCKPKLSEVTIILNCNKSKKYVKVKIVLGCDCTSVDCSCSTSDLLL